MNNRCLINFAPFLYVCLSGLMDSSLTVLPSLLNLMFTFSQVRESGGPFKLAAVSFCPHPSVFGALVFSFFLSLFLSCQDELDYIKS